MELKGKAQQLLNSSLYKSAYSRARYTLYGVVIRETQVSFRQFFTWKYPVRSFFRTVSIILSAWARLLLGRSLKYSFSHTGEDRILESIYKPLITRDGFYVDVGCNHPVLFSNTYSLYRRGWKGICIDANEDLIQKFKFYRPRDKAVHALVSDTVTTREFFILQNDVLSTTERQFLDDYREQGLSVQQKSMTSQTLSHILDELQAPAEFDILSIDVEEHDYQALLSLDLNRYTPKLIIIEDESFDLTNPKASSVYEYLQKHLYDLKGAVLKNLYFTKNL